MRGETFEDIPLFGRPEFKGGILESDRQTSEVERMQTETKEITSTPSTEQKDAPVESGVKVPDRTPGHPEIETPVHGSKHGETA